MTAGERLAIEQAAWKERHDKAKLEMNAAYGKGGTLKSEALFDVSAPELARALFDAAMWKEAFTFAEGRAKIPTEEVKEPKPDNNRFQRAYVATKRVLDTMLLRAECGKSPHDGPRLMKIRTESEVEAQKLWQHLKNSRAMVGAVAEE
jgi:hypothetical protein